MNVNITGPRILAEFSFFGLCDVTITQTTLTSLLVLAAVTILCWRLGRNLRKRPGRMQAVTERAVLAVYKLVDDTMGKHNERFAPYIGALFCSSVLGSLASLTGFLRSSTADLSTTLTWALMTTALVWYNNIKNNGFFGWLKGFTEPVVVMTPMNIISEIEQPISMSFRHFVLGTVAIFIYVGVEVGIPNFMNLFLTSTPDAATPGIGMAAAAAGSLVGTYWFLMMCGRLIGGVIGGKVSSKAQLTAVSVVALVFVLLGIFAPIDTMGRMPVFTGTGFAMIEVPIGVMFLTLCGLCTSVMWGGIFNMAVEGLGKYTALASGMFMTMVCGGGILIPLQGWVADITGSFAASYIVVILCSAYILFYALIGSKNVNKNIPVA